MDYLTSDTHYSHFNIIRYTNRPFLTVKEMDEQLLENTNKLVKENDRLFHLGDFAKQNAPYYRDKIKCKNVFLIRGNHDRLKLWEEHLFSGVADLKEVKTDINGEIKGIVLCHYAMRVYNKSHHGSYHAFGHSHSTLPDDPNTLSMDVGVDNIAKLLSPDGAIRRKEDYRPISVVEFAEFMKLKTWKPIDHHGRDCHE
jgi:calcineurin-like phosphoesterase family protein